MKSWPDKANLPPSLVFFDGVCGLCNRFVDFTLRRDTAEKLRFAPLQGQTAAGLLDALELDENGSPRSILYWDGAQLYAKSDAALRILRRLGGIWFLSGIFLAVPRVLRDGVYGFVARNRYAWFGKRESCRLPSAAERARFFP